MNRKTKFKGVNGQRSTVNGKGKGRSFDRYAPQDDNKTKGVNGGKARARPGVKALPKAQEPVSFVAVA
ncbi:MAG TPA: hypothetical protein PLP89_04485 [Synergistales bacterium]|nr:hypothetical protein [Synergistales bacterium]